MIKVYTIVYLKVVDQSTPNQCWIVCAKGDPGAVKFSAQVRRRGLQGRAAIDLTGKVYGRLTVIERNGSNALGHAMWKCLCRCGKVKTIIGAVLRRGHAKSCGCLAIEIILRRNILR